MRVAVENYELYNNGVLICKWFDLEDYSLEEIQEEIVEYIEENHADDDFNTDDMELFVADYEDDSGLFSGESLTEALEVQEQIDDLDEDDLKAISILVETGWASDVEDAIDKKDDIHNTGETDMEDVAYNYIEETGALGDMACHILHPVFKALDLGYPTKAQGTSTLLLTDCAPSAQTVKLAFPERKKVKKMKMPEVEVSWYDGGIQPMKPEGWPEGKSMNDSGGGVIFHGTKDKLVCGCYGVNPWLLSGREPNVPKTLPRVNLTHEMDWVRACKESPENRVPASSDFSEAGPFNEMVVMGVLAVRLQGLNKELNWDGENMRFTNISGDEKIKTVIADNFSIHNGHPTFNKEWTDPMSAVEFSQELIKHNYRDGWKLPDMPA